MKNISAILILLLAIAISPNTATAHALIQCDVKLNSENHFAYLAGGKAFVDLNTGALVVETESTKKNLITEDYVSTRMAPTSSCKLDKAIESEANGDLKSYKFYYVDCLLPSQRLITASNSYNWKTNRGVYQEALNVNGNYAITFFFLENCKKLSSRW